VQVAPQAPTLLLARGDQLLARALELRRQAHGIGRGSRLAGEVGQQRAIGAREWLVRATLREREPADLLPVVDECQPFQVAARRAMGGDDDRLTPLKYGEYLATNIPGAVLKIIHGAGHLAMLEQPTEVNAVITSFIHSLED